MAQVSIPDTRLRDIDRNPVTLTFIQQQNITVLVFINHECPITQQYMPLLAKLSGHYTREKVAFYGIFPPAIARQQDLQRFRTNYAVPFPLLIDSKKGQCTRWLRATVTPEVFLIDSTGQILYQGAIDNQYYTLGKRRSEVTENYLADALEAALTHTEIKIKQTKPVGCLIELTNR